jgi:hypothetical protein
MNKEQQIKNSVIARAQPEAIQKNKEIDCFLLRSSQ